MTIKFSGFQFHFVIVYIHVDDAYLTTLNVIVLTFNRYVIYRCIFSESYTIDKGEKNETMTHKMPNTNTFA